MPEFAEDIFKIAVLVGKWGNELYQFGLGGGFLVVIEKRIPGRGICPVEGFP